MSDEQGVQIIIGPSPYMGRIIVQGQDISRYVTRIGIDVDADDLTCATITLSVPLWDGVRVEFLPEVTERGKK